MTGFDYGVYMKTNTDALMTWARGIINDPDPNTGHVMFDEFQCNTCEGSGEIADPDAFDPWAEAA